MDFYIMDSCNIMHYFFKNLIKVSTKSQNSFFPCFSFYPKKYLISCLLVIMFLYQIFCELSRWKKKEKRKKYLLKLLKIENQNGLLLKCTTQDIFLHTYSSTLEILRKLNLKLPNLVFFF
jgi:hypothetical protein